MQRKRVVKLPAALLRSADLWSGVLFSGLGAAALVLGWEYQPGTAFQMGPGYFPRLIGGVLIVIGLITVIKALRHHGEEIGEVPWRAIVIVLGALVAFGLVIPRFGLAPASLVAVMIAGLAAPDRKLGQLAFAAVFLTVFACIVFIKALGLTVPIYVWE